MNMYNLNVQNLVVEKLPFSLQLEWRDRIIPFLGKSNSNFISVKIAAVTKKNIFSVDHRFPSEVVVWWNQSSLFRKLDDFDLGSLLESQNRESQSQGNELETGASVRFAYLVSESSK